MRPGPTAFITAALVATLCSYSLAQEESSSNEHEGEVGALQRAWDTPRRVYITRPLTGDLEAIRATRGPHPFFALIEWLDEANVILIGEHHDDPATHLLELELLYAVSLTSRWAAFANRGSTGLPVLALEMFERDVQPWLDTFATKSIREAYFLENARPWSNYVEHYRPLITWQMRLGEAQRVVASNAPTPISRRVAREGLEAVLPTLSEQERGWIAAETTAPRDEYWERFVEAMGGGASDASHGHHMGEDALYRFYQAQCLKDDTMAETIARLREADPQRQVIHLSGSFHIDYGLGIVPRLKARRPHDRIVTVAIRPVPDIDAVDPTEYAGLADYVVFVPAPLEEEADEPAGAMTGEGSHPTD